MKNANWRRVGYFLGFFILFIIGFSVGYGIGKASGIIWTINFGTSFLENHGVNITYTSEQIGNVIVYYMEILEERGGLFIP